MCEVALSEGHEEADALHDVRIETRSGLSADDTMEIDVLPNGGFVLDID